MLVPSSDPLPTMATSDTLKSSPTLIRVELEQLERGVTLERPVQVPQLPIHLGYHSVVRQTLAVKHKHGKRRQTR